MTRIALTAGLVFVIISQMSGSLLARTWYITPDGLGDAPTIQAGIDSAAAADTVLLSDGTYMGDGNRDVDFRSKAVAVVSESGDPVTCVIACGGSETEPHRGFAFVSGETEATILEGVTVENGYMTISDTGTLPDYSGAGVICYFSSPTIMRCDFVGNAAHLGGGITCSDASPVITDCDFRENQSFEWIGGAIACVNSGSPTVSGCTFSQNSAVSPWPSMPALGGAVAVMEPSTPALTGCTFVGNSATAGGAVFYYPGTSLVVTDCVFCQNEAEEGGAISCRFDIGPAVSSLGNPPVATVVSGCTFDGNTAVRGGALHLTEDAEIHVTDCTLHANAAEQGSGIYVDTFVATLERMIISFGDCGEAVYVYGGGLNSDVTLSCCDLYGNAGGDWVGVIADQLGLSGNFSGDPLFCGAEVGDFTIETCSPCLPGNHPDSGECDVVIGAFGSGCPCGTMAEQTTWGSIKRMYK